MIAAPARLLLLAGLAGLAACTARPPEPRHECITLPHGLVSCHEVQPEAAGQGR